MILCFGDSLTEGRPGVTYLKYMNHKKDCLNYGLGGDTLMGMSNRLKSAYKRPEYQNCCRIVIGIGTNDILLPYLKTYSRSWQMGVRRLIKRGSIPCQNEKMFSSEYERLLSWLKSQNKEPLIIGIPCIETEANDLDKIAECYNSLIEDLCLRYQTPFIDFRATQKRIKKEQNNHGSYFFVRNNLNVGADALLTTYLPFTDYISQKRGLALTVDGVHFNTVSGRELARLVDKSL